MTKATLVAEELYKIMTKATLVAEDLYDKSHFDCRGVV